MKTLYVTPLLIASMAVFGFLHVPVASALDPAAQMQRGVVKAGGTADNQKSAGSVFKTITNVILFILGAVAVIMIIYGGIRYTISGGDGTSVTAAKNTILYAVVGLVVALLAYAIVNFVIKSF